MRFAVSKKIYASIFYDKDGVRFVYLLCHNPEDHSAITRRLHKFIQSSHFTNSHSTDVNQVPSNSSR